MALIAKRTAGTGFAQVPAGGHKAICYAVIDLGSHINPFRGNIQKRVMLLWELPEETHIFDGEEKPLVINKEYTLSLHENASLTKDLESWRGQPFTEEELAGFDIKKLLGAKCILSVIHNTGKNGNTYSNVASVTAAPRGTPFPEETYNDKIFFDLENPDALEALDGLYPWIQAKIKESIDYKQMEEVLAPDDFKELDVEEGDLPF